MGTTDEPQHLHSALRRAFAARVHIGMPTKEQRERIVDTYFKGTLKDVLREEACEVLDGYSRSDIYWILERVCGLLIRKSTECSKQSVSPMINPLLIVQTV